MPACENKLALCKTAVKRQTDGEARMAENVVGETGFEPATLCSQSQQEAPVSALPSVKPSEIPSNGIKGLPGPCKTAVGGSASADLSGHHTHFQREERYIVVKRKHLTPLQEQALRAHISRLGVSIVEGVFVERDWPEYETVWQMILGPVTAPTPVQSLESAGHQCFSVSQTSYLCNLDRSDPEFRSPWAIHYQRPPQRNDDGSTSLSLIMPAFVVTGYIAGQQEVAEKAAEILNRYWDDPEAGLRMAAAIRAVLPRNVCLTNANVPDSTVVPLDITMGELRALARAVPNG